MKLDPEKWLKGRVVMIEGDEPTLRRRALDALLAAAGTGPEDFDFETFSADSRTPIEWIGAASTIPFMSPRRTVLVRHLLRADAPDKVNLKSVPESGLVILVADEETTVDESRLQRLGSISKAWEKHVKAAGGTVVSCSSDPKTLEPLIRQEAKALGKDLSTVAAKRLLEMTGGSYSRANDELAKLALYVGDAGAIREEDVLAATSPSRDWNVFKLVDAVVAGQATTALSHLRVLVSGKGKADDAAQRHILPQLHRQFRLAWQARCTLDGKAPSEHLPDRHNLSKESSWSADRAMRLGRALSLSQIARCLNELALADAKLKGLEPSASAMETLELLVLRIGDVVKPPLRAAD